MKTTQIQHILKKHNAAERVRIYTNSSKFFEGVDVEISGGLLTIISSADPAVITTIDATSVTAICFLAN